MAAHAPDDSTPSTRPTTTVDSRRKTADTIFRGALAFNAALTVFWLVTFLGGGSYFFQDYRVDWQTVGRILFGVLVFYVVWGIIWWAVKAALLRFFVGFTKEERRDAFSSRMDRPYDVGDLVSRYSERRIRIADMIGRRGRFMTLAAAPASTTSMSRSRATTTPTSPAPSSRTTCSTASSPAGSSSGSTA